MEEIDPRLTDERTDRALTIFEARADEWAVEINLPSMVNNVVSPMRLNRSAPDDVRERFTHRMKEQIDAIVKQAFIEGAYRNHCSNADIILPCDIQLPDGVRVPKGKNLSELMRQLAAIARAAA